MRVKKKNSDIGKETKKNDEKGIHRNKDKVMKRNIEIGKKKEYWQKERQWKKIQREKKRKLDADREKIEQ